jgi:hypothetical protein
MTHPNQRRAGHGSPIWTAAEKAELLRLRADNVPRAECARRLGKTKNAIIGQLDRLLRQGKYKPGPEPHKVGQNTNPFGWNGVKKRKPLPRVPPKEPYRPMQPKSAERYAPSLPVVRAVANPVPLMDLGSRHCRYIGDRPELLTIDSAIYCGAPTDGGSWCPEHKARCIAPVRPRFFAS